MLRSISRRLALWLVVASLAFTGSAQALTLADLAAGGSLTSGNGLLLFDDFDFVVSGALSTDLSNYSVVALDDGFRIAGPIGVAENGVGDLLLEYSVSTTGEGTQISGASLLFNGAASGEGSLASVSEDFFGRPSPVFIGDLLVGVTGGGISDKTDELGLEPTVELRVLKDILVIGGEQGFATISAVDQRFATVPEPGTALLLGLGLAGLAFAGRRRA